MKFSSIDRLMDGISMAGKLGLRTVIGNGVASELGCWMEACVARFVMNNDGEMNGFLKPIARIFENPLHYENGSILLPPDFKPTINRKILQEYSLWTHEAT